MGLTLEFSLTIVAEPVACTLQPKWRCYKAEAEAEYIAMTHATKELLWICNFLSEVFRPLQFPSLIHADNQSAITMAYHDTFHPWVKHIALPYHFIRDQVEKQIVELSWVSNHLNLADLFTKVLTGSKTCSLSFGLGLHA